MIHDSNNLEGTAIWNHFRQLKSLMETKEIGFEVKGKVLKEVLRITVEENDFGKFSGVKYPTDYESES